MQFLLVAAACFLVGFFVCEGVRRRAIALDLLDHPVERSSHEIPTPRGGGLGIVVAFYCLLGVLWACDQVPTQLALALLPGLALAAIGFLDDRKSQPASLRLSIHLTSAAAAMWTLGGWPVLNLGFALWAWPAWLGFGLGVLLIAWAINFTNFMDGIDGLAGAEGVFLSLGGALLISGTGETNLLVGLAAACTGFLVRNWPPARIFMGDVGSGLIGFVVLVIALYESNAGTTMLWSWAILVGVFFVDATVTLLRRMIIRQAFWDAHRTHAYQWASRQYGSHAKVTLAVCAINLVWLLPLAWAAYIWPVWGLIFLGIAYLPLVYLALRFKAGTPEQR